MISNTSYKVKASTSSRELHNNYHELDQTDEYFESDHMDGISRPLVYSSRDPRYKGARSRQPEYRYSKSGPSERRGYKGRGTKYHDSLSHVAEPGGMYFRSKCYEPEKKLEIKFKLPEDTRISKLLRRLSIEGDQELSLQISKKLLEVLVLPENSHYIRKAFHILGDSVLDILHVAPGMVAKKQVARGLGRMAYIMGQECDFARFQDWMFTKLSQETEEIRYLFLRALGEMLEFEKKTPVLQDYADNFIQDLIAMIEVIENVQLFKAALEILISIVEIYPHMFYSQFNDAVDIFFGWHVDGGQSLLDIEFISTQMQRIKKHFQMNLEFSTTLALQFIEDIENAAKDLNKDHNKNSKSSLDYFTVTILALNTVLKCLDDEVQASNGELIPAKYITDCILQNLKTLTNTLERQVADDLVIATNENLSLLLGFLNSKSGVLCNSIYALITLEISLIKQFSEPTVISMLLMISKVVKELSANLPLELVQQLVGPHSKIIELRYSTNNNFQEATLCVYQSLLNLKNIPLLQEAYCCVLGNLEVVYKKIVPTSVVLCYNNPFSETDFENNIDSERTILFLLRSLSQLANSSGSIIGLWALKPSILELLAVLLEPYNSYLSSNMPSLQYCILYLLYSHCKCYQNFIASSTLVSKKHENGLMGMVDGIGQSKSPNFAIILDVLQKTLSTTTSSETTLLLLQWLNDVLVNAGPYLIILYNCPEFNRVTEVLLSHGYDYDHNVVLAVCTNLKRLLSRPELSWSNSFLVAVNDLCVLHMNSNNLPIRSAYTNLIENLPWDLAVIECGKTYNNISRTGDLKAYNNYTVALAQQLHLSGSVYGEMLPLHFLTFMKYLLHGEECENEGWLEDIFMCSWPVEADPQINQINMECFRSLALSSRAVLNNWSTFEAAQLCVNSKLRTPLGKPNETFTSFENVLKQLAKDVMKAKCDSEESGTTNKASQRRVRLLLLFMEHLEKSIYNAAEGCAIAMPPVAKPVRAFFHTNASTCKEWLTRIRIVIMHIALHAGQSVIALRHGQELLKHLVTTKKSNTIEFERTVMYVTLSLLNLRESGAISGLYTWCKKHSEAKFDWVKHASDQASKKYEIAAQNYKAIIELKPSSTLDPQIHHFVLNQIINCYKELNNWSELVKWQKEHSSNQNENGLRYSFITVNNDCAQALSEVELLHTMNKLNKWDDDECTNSWSSYSILRKTECDLYNIALNINSPEDETLLNKVNSDLHIIQEGLQDNLLTLPTELLPTFSLMYYIANGLKTVLNKSLASNVFLVSENFENDIEKIDSTILLKILWWSEYFSRDHHNPGFNSFCSRLRLHIIKMARKEKNFSLACLHLNKFLAQEEIFKKEIVGKQLTIEEIGNLLLQKTSELSTCTVDVSKAVKESIKLLYATDENKQLVFDLSAAASTSIFKNAKIFCNHDMRKISSKILLKLANWLQNNEHNANVSLTEMSSSLVKLLMVLPEIGLSEQIGTTSVPANEIAMGRILQFSVHQCMNLAKNWFAFGTWSYRWGRKVVDQSLDNNSFTDADKIAIRNCLPNDISEDDYQKVLGILLLRPITNEEDIDSNELNMSEIVEDKLKSVLPCLGEEELQGLVQIWRKLQKRIYAYYELSADSYFKYLHLVTNSDNLNSECNSITATLRLLRLVVKHALELQNVLEDGLATTPTQPWKVIIPQLFSRLNHPEAYVRQRVSELLCRVAEDAPHLITFPAVVGAVEGGVKFDFSEMSISKDCFSQGNEANDENELNEIEDTYESDTEETKNVLQSCFKSMVETLSKQAPEAITQVQLLVKELRRITLLWDELWLGTLVQYHSEIMQRQHQLEVEIEKVNENVNLDKDEKISLITEKYRIIIKPIIFIFEQLQSVTSVEPETPHEKQFQERYADVITEVIQKLKNPDHPDKPPESWQPIKMLQSKFQQKAHKRTAYTLKMQDISPILANMKDTVIAMPGLNAASKTQVSISSLSNHVSILPTKTKPKKLIFYGSDGQSYPYLFKGLEDLHLDERIMQFLSIANTMMAQGPDTGSHNIYRARHYSVIPLGPRSGLISWVEGTTPVFALYKRWQQREAAKVSSKASSNQRSNSNANIAILRPSELFYNKLNPLLQEHGVKNLENRKEWPVSILKQVLAELMIETPNSLLAKELWCHSVTAGEWWQVVKKYSYSVAVMSTIGYIIGLGDRHLDNVLVDLSTGEVVHIDYNVCFEKGKTLRVPEKVPFRLTPNIVEALGVTGIEGIFRLVCENVLKTMKKGRETLLTLLEAFVYDPLVDWTVGGEGLAGAAFRGLAGRSLTRQNRKDLEKEVTLSMYNVRCTEMKIDWFNNRDNIIEHIPIIISHLNEWFDEYEKVRITEDLLQDLHQQMTLVKEAEANGINKHSLYSLPKRYESFRKTQDTITLAQTEVNSLIHDAEQHIENYTEAIKLLDSHQYSQWILELNTGLNSQSGSVFDLVKEFLQNAGQSNMSVQCEQSETELEQLKQQQTLATTKCLHLLQEYSTVLTQCPPSYRDKHRMLRYLNWSKYLLKSDMTTCESIYNQFYAFLEGTKSLLPVKSVVEYAYHLNLQCNETAAAVNKVYDELSKLKDTNSHVEQRYNNAEIAVSSFIRCENDGLSALKYIILNELCKQNKEFANSERALSRSGKFTLKIPCQKGEWILDDLNWHSSNVLECIRYLVLQQNSHKEDHLLVQAVNSLQAISNTYKGLQEFYYNFHTIILPESMKKILSEENSVIMMISELDNLVSNFGKPINEVIIQLEKQLTCIVMEMELNPTCLNVLDMVSQLKTQYQTIIQGQMDNLSQGKMLLMGFNGLFDKLNLELRELINVLNIFEPPQSWRNVDQAKQSRNLAPPIFNTRVKAVLDDIFLLKRLQTMLEFFNLCVEMCKSFKTPMNVIVLNDEQLDKPVKKYITDFISRQVLGISTETVAYTTCILLQSLGLNVASEIEQKDIGAEINVSLDELNKKSGNLCLKQGVFTQNTLAQASSLYTNLKSTWSVMQDIKLHEQHLSILQSSLVRIQNLLSTHSWLHEGVFGQSPVVINTAMVRNKFISDFSSEMSNLNSVITKITDSREQQKNLITCVNSRLNWAAGVNPDVTQVMSSFESAVAIRENRLDIETQIANAVLKTCRSIFQHEILRSQSPEAEALDKRFLSNFQMWQNGCQLRTVEIVEVTSTEASIMQLYTPDMVNNTKWIHLISEKISDIITGTQKQLSNEKEALCTSNENVKIAIDTLKYMFSKHNKLMLEVKPLLKSMLKIEEYSNNVHEFMDNYKTYQEHFSPVLHAFKKDITNDEKDDLMKYLVYLRDATNDVYENLMNFESKEDDKRTIRPPLLRQETVQSPTKTILPKQDSTTKGQQRNVYAMGVWRRVRLKLEGRDPDPGRKYTNQEQVDYIIREASNLDNLALMYEGWTPWV